MQLRFGFSFALLTLSLAGCSHLAINNGSLDYKDASSLEPLKYPEGVVSRPATPLYPAPVVDPLAIQHAPTFENQRGNRFAMPRPDVQVSEAPSSDESNAAQTSTSIGQPQLITDGSGNPLIKVDGNSATIWQYTLATLTSLNHTIVGKSKNANEATVKINNQIYVVKLTSVGASNTLAVFNADNSFADKSKATELLTQIYQNWPA
ncbi:lipoprotein-34 precursor (NlpB) [Acinetobacter gerneri]|uniref:lipoprotein-34 precursor (NlpB) n=1 Tax=Acinetobacter gerneri TaxID=202952 RepID=UPI0028A5B1CF|nr:lipoprotein-34 precursor (NlpB) [Acinetobacter gerneri]